MKPIARLIVFGMVLGCVVAVRAEDPPPLGPPLHVGLTNGLVNELGQPMKGVSPAAATYGHTPVPGEVVQILLVTNGLFPPDVNGNPDPRNEVVFSGRVGDGMDPVVGASAMFGFSVPNRPAGGEVAARVFNKSSLADSSFYGDSQVFPVNAFFNDAFVPQLSQTLQPIDTGDPDGDGLINSWEKSLAGDPGNPDTDGDGMADGNEWRAGTELTNSLSVLSMVQLDPVDNEVMGVMWDSVTGKVYVVEFRAGDLLASTNNYVPMCGAVTALTASTSILVTNDLSPLGHYRVRLIEP